VTAMAGRRLKGPTLTRLERRLLIAGLAAGLAAAMILIWPSAPPERAAIAPPPAAPAATAPTSPEPKRMAKAESAPPPVSSGESFELEPPYRILDGLTLAAGRVTVTLDGLEGPPAKAACRGSEGALWACGLQARAALNNATRQRRLSCRGTGRTETLPTGEEAMRTACIAEGEDLARRLVVEGWAKPAPDRPEFRGEVEEARGAGRGLWNGGWSLVVGSP
jgi:endonuclease YncB( thermonuclease family)